MMPAEYSEPQKFLGSWLGLVLALGLLTVGCPDEKEPMPADAEPWDAGADAADVLEDVSEDVDGDDSETGVPTSELSLLVRGLDGKPVEAATVTVGDDSETTDESGEVAFSDLVAGRTVAQIDASGYAPSTRVVDLPESVSVAAAATLIETGPPQTFDSTTASSLYQDRARVEIPADALVDDQGEVFSGTAEMTITPLNPSTDESAAYPGPMTGILEGDTEPMPMESVLMADVQMQKENGEPLSLKSGQEGTLEFVLPDNLQGDYTAGDQIEAYSYDPEAGVWKQEGMGEVGESSYAAGKLAWRVDVSHFSWWNCDKPWTDKNCVEVKVVNSETDSPVPGATVHVDGVSYNGTTTGTTGTDGKSCINFKLDSEAEITVQSPEGLFHTTDSKRITGSPTPATCAGEGEGECQEVTVEVGPPSCLSGDVEDQDGNLVDGADVTASYSGAGGRHVNRTETDSNGEFCVPVPQDAEVEVSVLHVEGGDAFTASKTVTADASPQSCEDGNCTDAGTLSLEPGGTGCVTGTVGEAGSEDEPPAPGTHVYAYTLDSDVVPDCTTDPSEWGTLLSKTTTDADGNFCLPISILAAPHSAEFLTGKCGENDEECLSEPTPADMQLEEAACGEDGCFSLGPTLPVPACGEGP